MSALLAINLTTQKAKSLLIWPMKDFPYNALVTTAGFISVFALPKIFSSYSSLLFTSATLLISIKLFQENEEAKKKLKINEIKNEISALEGFENNNPKIMKLYLKLDKKTIEPMLNRFNENDYQKIKKLTKYSKIKIADIIAIWNKAPNFNENSFNKRYSLLRNILDNEMKKVFDSTSDYPDLR